MITLSDKIRKNGINYTLIQKGMRTAIYKQTDTKEPECYEVFVLRFAPEKNINGKILPERERFPSNEDFGKFAWTYRTLTEAIKRFSELEKLL